MSAKRPSDQADGPPSKRVKVAPTPHIPSGPPARQLTAADRAVRSTDDSIEVVDLTSTAESALDVPRVSVGPAFGDISEATPDFLSIIRAGSQSRPLGLSNHNGTSCYYNACLAVLLSSPRFVSYLQNWHMVKEYRHEERFHKRRAHILQMLYSMSYTSQSGSPELNHRDTDRLHSRRERNGSQDAHDHSARLLWRRVCNPGRPSSNDLVEGCQLSTLWTIPRASRDDRNNVIEGQEDASEWLIWLLTTIDEQLENETIPGFPTAEQERFKWLFELKQTSRVLCPKCKWPVQRRENPTQESDSKQLLLEIPERAGVSAFAARATPVPLKQLVANSMATSYSKNTCTRCGQGIQNIAQEIKRIRRFPELLILNLSRNKYVKKVGSVVKDHGAVSIPEYLDLSQFLEPSSFGAQSKVQYRLRGVVSHQGLTVDSGHYISYIRVDHEDGYEWLEINNTDVEDCSLYRFNDSHTSWYEKEEDFNARFEPCVMIYELDHENSVTLPGRQLRNIDEGENVDERPTEWLQEADDTTVAQLGTVAAEPSNAQVTTTTPYIDKVIQSSHANATATASHPPGVDATSDTQPTQPIAMSSAWPVILAAAVNVLPKIAFSGFDNETTFPQAEVDLTLQIDGAEFKMPKRFINHFNVKKQRQVEIEATIKVPTGSAQDVQGKKQDQLETKELDLAKVFIDARIERKEKLLPSTAQQLKQAKSGTRRGLRSQTQDQDLLGADDLDKAERQARLKNRQTWPSRWRVVQAAPKTKPATGANTKDSTKGSKKNRRKKKKK